MNYTTPPDQQAYNEQVWHLACQVPPGMVVTYGQIAQLIPLPTGIDPDEYTEKGHKLTFSKV